MFKTNLAHTGIIFPDDSPYYRGINEKDILWLRPSFKKALEPIAKLKSLYPEFTRLELATMYNYTDHEFMYLNPLMNKEITNKFIRTYENILNNTLDKCKSYKDFVFRGIMDDDDDILEKYAKGKIIKWK